VRRSGKGGIGMTSHGNSASSARTVYDYTGDLPKVERAPRKFVTRGLVRTIRNRLRSGFTRTETVEDLGVSPSAVGKCTRDFPNKQGRHFGGWTLQFLQYLTKDGFFIPRKYETDRTRAAYEHLKLDGFRIRHVYAERKHVYFLEGGGREAFKAFQSATNTKVIDYNFLVKIMPLFDIPKKEYKEAAFGKTSLAINAIRELNQKKRALGDAVSDYIGRFLHSELLA